MEKSGKWIYFMVLVLENLGITDIDLKFFFLLVYLESITMAFSLVFPGG